MRVGRKRDTSPHGTWLFLSIREKLPNRGANVIDFTTAMSIAEDASKLENIEVRSRAFRLKDTYFITRKRRLNKWIFKDHVELSNKLN